jgi:putative long chain acyl-CoA synthase
VNLTGKKPGSLGRPLPGSAKVRIVRYDLDRGMIVPGPDGFAIRCRPGETGLLLAKGDGPDPLRGVFEPGDSWVATGDLFQRDGDGDHWLVGRTSELVHTPRGAVPTGLVRDRVGNVPGVDLAVVYGIPAGRFELVAAAVTLRSPVSAEDFTAAFPDEGPALIRVVEEIETSAYARLLTRALREEGVPDAGTAFFRDAGGRYRPLTDADRQRLRAL